MEVKIFIKKKGYSLKVSLQCCKFVFAKYKTHNTGKNFKICSVSCMDVLAV